MFLIIMSARVTYVFDYMFDNRLLIHAEIANKMQQCIKIYYSMFTWSSPFFAVRPVTSTSNNLSRMQNQRLLVQFWAPDDRRCVAQNMLSFI